MRRLESIQHLRGIAALLVVFVHFPTPLARFCGSIGVDIFFFISGFIIFTSIDKSKYWNQPLIFLKKRLLRIIPLYFLVTLLFIVTNLVLNSINAAREIKIPVDLNWMRVVKSYLFIPIENNGVYNDPVVFLGWSLNFEMLFYLLAFFCLLIFRKKFFWPLLSLLLGLSLIGFLVKGFTDIYLDFFTSPFLLYFAVGLLVGKYQELIINKVAPFSEPLFFIAIYIMFVVMFAKDSGYEFTGIAREIVIYNEKSIPRIFIWGIPSLLFFISYFSLAEKYNIRSSYLNKLGDRSYSIYLLQIFFIYSLLEFSSRFNRYEKVALSMILIVLLVWVSGISFRYFEKKFHQ